MMEFIKEFNWTLTDFWNSDALEVSQIYTLWLGKREGDAARIRMKG